MTLSRMNRAVASLLAVILVVSLVFAPAMHVKAEDAFAGSAEVQFTMRGMDVGVKVSADTGRGMFAVNGGMGINGNTMVQAGLYLGSEGLVLELLPILKSAVGVDLANLSDKLPKSIFAPNSGSSFAMDQETYDTMMSSLNAALQQSVPGQVAQFGQEQVEVLMPHIEALIAAVMEKAEVVTASVDGLPGLDPEEEAVLTAIYLNPEALATVLGETIESVASDSKAITVIGAILDQSAGQGSHLIPEGKTGEEVLREALADVAKVRENLTKDILSSNAELTVNLFTGAEEGELMGVSLNMVDKSTDVTISVFFGDGYIGLWMTNKDETIHVEFNLTENNDEVLDWSFVLDNKTSVSDKSASMVFHWNKATGEFVFSVESDDGAVSNILGTIETAEDTAVITVTSMNDTDMTDMNLHLILRANDPIEVPEYQDVLSMSEEEFQAFFQNAYTTVTGLFGAMTQ